MSIMEADKVVFRDPSMYSSNSTEQARIKELVLAHAPFGASSAVIVLDVSRQHVLDEPPPQSAFNWNATTKSANKRTDKEAFLQSKPYGIMALSMMSRPLWAYREHPGLLQEENVWISLPVSQGTPTLLAIIAGRKVIGTETVARARRNSC
ncbi:uncharacterized protein PG986_013083 [Apiospora aurea]|uniref:Uncharacterized protein n=1 Tax=Apiospora aurea TaxID=335848 RepID=A0ABR1Q216_9PEZI